MQTTANLPVLRQFAWDAKNFVSALLAIGLLPWSFAGHALEPIMAPAHAWESLSKSEQGELKDFFEVRIIPIESYGITVDGQTIDKSQPGSTAGTRLGAAVGSAMYVDRAFSGNNWNYSVSRQLGVEILGALVGSLANAPPTSEFLSRYFVKSLNGTISVVDVRSSNAFRIPNGVCVELAPLRLARTAICEATRDELLARLDEQKQGEIKRAFAPSLRNSNDTSAEPGALVLCKIGNSLPAKIERGTCLQAGGTINE